MTQLNFDLHPAQLEIFDDPARFKVVVAGRRFGKSYLAAIMLLIEALKETAADGYDLTTEGVYYVAPTFESGKKTMWDVLKKLAKMEKDGGLIAQAHENTAVLTLVNGRKISIKGADRPDTLRGVGLSYVVMDEYAFMKEGVWDMVLRPTLSRSRGGAMFIGTPDGKNHFFDLFEKANTCAPGYEDWKAWQFESLKNPTLDPAEVDSAIRNMSVGAARQEYGASFNSGGGIHFPEELWKYGPRPADGNYYVSVDLAGFADGGSLKRGELKIKDEHSICVVKAGEDGWFVEEIMSGQWDVRETAVRIARAYVDYRPYKLGIEKGALKNAVGPYLEDEMKRNKRWFTPHELTHGGNKKSDRILWGIQGRLEKGRITLNKEEGTIKYSSVGWQRKLIGQANDFPSSLSHDDLLDSLAYIDQLADYYSGELGEQDTHEIYDEIIGF